MVLLECVGKKGPLGILGLKRQENESVVTNSQDVAWNAGLSGGREGVSGGPNWGGEGGPASAHKPRKAKKVSMRHLLEEATIGEGELRPAQQVPQPGEGRPIV